jgi:HEAT repeat protein
MISTKLWLTQYKLTSKSVQTRLLAVRKLREVPGESSVKLLIEALKDSEPAVRSEAAAALGSMKDGSAINPLIEALKDSAVGMQEAAIQALQRIGDPSAMAALVTCLMRGLPE